LIYPGRGEVFALGSDRTHSERGVLGRRPTYPSLIYSIITLFFLN